MHAVTKPFSALALTFGALSAVSAAACTGEVSNIAGTNPATAGSTGMLGTGGTGATGATGGGGIVPPTTCSQTTTRAPLRRMTRFEYNNTVRDLLADTSLPPKARDVVHFFFDNLLPISSLASLEREAAVYPTFNAKIGSRMRTETQTFLENEIFNGPGTWPGAFTAYGHIADPALAGITG